MFKWCWPGGPSSAAFGAVGFGVFSFAADSLMHGFMAEKPDPRILKKEKEEELILAAEIPMSVVELQQLVEKKNKHFQIQSVSVQW